MPVSDATNPDEAAMTAAMPVASISEQLQERLDRERRSRAIVLARERVALEQAWSAWYLETKYSPVDLAADVALLQQLVPARPESV